MKEWQPVKPWYEKQSTKKTMLLIILFGACFIWFLSCLGLGFMCIL